MRPTLGCGILALMGLVACGTADDGTNALRSSRGVPSRGAGSAGADDTAAGAKPTDEPSTKIVPGLSVSEVTVLQGVSVSVVKDGAARTPAQRNAPVVAHRPGLLRVYAKPAAGWSPRPVTAEVQLVADGKPSPILRDTKTIRAPSSDDDLDSTFDFELTADDLVPGVAFHVALTAADGVDTPNGDASEGRFPADGSARDLGVATSGTLKIVVVPVAYGADGSGRVPDLGPSALATYKQMMMKRYPVSDVEITVHAPFAWQAAIGADGTGFDELLGAMSELRQQDGVAADVYYYGAFAPAASFDDFCSAGCVAGLSNVADIDTPQFRASVGVAYGDDTSADTMAHEVGHAHGRDHAPCGSVATADAQFPYPDGQLGAWGYDILDEKLISPTDARDMMGYCPNTWISDYTYRALFDRIVALESGGGRESSGESVTPEAYHIASVGADGALRWVGSTRLRVGSALHASRGTRMTAHYLAETGAEMTTRSARFLRFDHLPGGFLLVPEASAPGWTSVRVDGARDVLRRRGE